MLIRPAGASKKRHSALSACDILPTPPNIVFLSVCDRRPAAAAPIAATPPSELPITCASNSVRSFFFRPPVVRCTRSLSSAGHSSSAGVLPEHDDFARFVTQQLRNYPSSFLAQDRKLEGCIPVCIRTLRRPHPPWNRAKAAR